LYYFFSTAGSVELTSEEKEEVESILSPLGVADDELENVYSVLRMAHCNTASIQVRRYTLGSGPIIIIGSFENLIEFYFQMLFSNCL